MNADLIHIPSGIDRLPSGWKWARLDSVTRGVFDCPHSTPVLTTTGPLLARTQDIRSGVFRVDQAARVSEETYRERTTRAIPTVGDLLYSREGTYFGIAAEVPPATPVCLGQRMVLIRPDADYLDSRYLKYWLNSPAMAAHIQGFRDGSVAERLNLPTIRSLPIPIPTLDDQRAIAHILGTLDDKIELNRRMNETLEEIARTLFTSWFVTFDPVRAKAEGRQPEGMDAETAALFPDSFVDSELGEIPAGWEIVKVGDILELAYGKALKESNRRPGHVPVYGSNGPVGFHDEALVKGPGIVVGRKGTAGSVTRVDEDFFPIDTTFYVVLDDACIPSLSYATYMLRNLDLSKHGSDSAVPGLNRNTAYSFKITLPNSRLIQAYENTVTPLFSLQESNRAQIGTLSAIRDVLLPKLLSGKLRVTEAETLVGQAV